MRTFILAAFVLVGLPAALPGIPAQAQALPISGTVTKIDEGAGKITLRHGPIRKLDMEEPMTMVFRAQTPDLLTQVKPGDKVRFDAERVNGQFTVTGIEKAK